MLSEGMSSPLLDRRHYTPPPGLPFLGDLTLGLGRVHEFCGPSRRMLALMVAARMTGPVFWIHSHWQKDRLNGQGICGTIDPNRLTFVTPKRIEDILWSMEECLRAGIVPLVVAELPDPPLLTPIRRLHLAAEQGGQNNPSPLGLILTPGDGGAQGVESRWHMLPRHVAGQDNWMLQRRRARMAPEAAWAITLRDNGPEITNKI